MKVLQAVDLTIGYEMTRPLVERWTASFSEGEVVAITAPSGRGKSTVLYVLGLMLRPISGSILLEGAPIGDFGDAARASLRAHRYGFVFQDAALDASRTVMDNVLESSIYRGDYSSAAVERAEFLLEKFGVAMRASAKPGQVSGGQAQRIALCRALLGSPRILLADEPTGNLDPATANVVISAFHEHARSGAAVVVVTHDPAVVAACDRRIEL